MTGASVRWHSDEGPAASYGISNNLQFIDCVFNVWSIWIFGGQLLRDNVRNTLSFKQNTNEINIYKSSYETRAELRFVW